MLQQKLYLIGSVNNKITSFESLSKRDSLSVLYCKYAVSKPTFKRKGMPSY